MAQEFVFEGRGKAQRTEIERTAMRNVRGAINCIVGEWYNAMQDGYDVADMPKSLQALKDDIYEASMSDAFGKGCCFFGCAPKEMRFAGKKFIKAYIDWIMDLDAKVGDTSDIAEYCGWEI